VTAEAIVTPAPASPKVSTTTTSSASRLSACLLVDPALSAVVSRWSALIAAPLAMWAGDAAER
jgi:hypothetical protein